MERENPHMKYLVVIKLGQKNNKIVAAKKLRHRGYERFGNGYFFLRVRKNVNYQETVDEEIRWLMSEDMMGYCYATMEIIRSRYSPYS